MNDYQSVKTGDNSETYLSANDINITNIGKGLDEETKIAKLIEIKSKLRDECVEDFNNLANHVFIESFINKKDPNKYVINNLDEKIESEIFKNEKALNTKIQDISKIEDMLISLCVYDRDGEFDKFLEVKRRVEERLTKLRNKDNTIDFIRKNKFVIFLFSIILILLFMVLAQRVKINDFNQSKVSEFGYNPIALEDTSQYKHVEHSVEIKKMSLKNSDCVNRANILSMNYGYIEEGRNSKSLWLVENNYKVHIKCYSEYGLVLFTVIGETSQGVLDRMNLVINMY